jgi:hypothetical protein
MMATDQCHRLVLRRPSRPDSGQFSRQEERRHLRAPSRDSTSAQVRRVVEEGKLRALNCATQRVTKSSHPSSTSAVFWQKSVATIWCCVSVRVCDLNCVIRVEEDVLHPGKAGAGRYGIKLNLSVNTSVCRYLER